MRTLIRNPILRWLAGVAFMAVIAIVMLSLLSGELDLYIEYSANQIGLGMQFGLFGVWAASSAAIAYAGIRTMHYAVIKIGAMEE